MGPLTLAHSGVSDLDISTICLLVIADIRLTDLGHELYLDLSRGGGDEVVVGGIGQVRGGHKTQTQQQLKNMHSCPFKIQFTFHISHTFKFTFHRAEEDTKLKHSSSSSRH